MAPGWKGFDNRRSYWAYLFARLKPGVSTEQAAAAMNGIFRPIINDVEAPLQRGMSDQTMARFRAKTLIVEAGQRGQSEVHSEARTPLILLFVDRRDRPADRLRQHRQPAARARAPAARPRWRCGCRSAPAGGSCWRSC